MEAMAVVASETFTSTSAPIQYAAVKAFQGSVEIERYLSHSRRILKALADWIWTRMTAAGIDVAKPDGAFYMLPDFEPLRAQLEKEGLSMVVCSVDSCLKKPEWLFCLAVTLVARKMN